MWRLNPPVVTFLFVEWTRIENDILQFFKKLICIFFNIRLEKTLLATCAGLSSVIFFMCCCCLFRMKMKRECRNIKHCMCCLCMKHNNSTTNNDSVFQRIVRLCSANKTSHSDETSFQQADRLRIKSESRFRCPESSCCVQRKVPGIPMEDLSAKLN